VLVFNGLGFTVDNLGKVDISVSTEYLASVSFDKEDSLFSLADLFQYIFCFPSVLFIFVVISAVKKFRGRSKAIHHLNEVLSIM